MAFHMFWSAMAPLRAAGKLGMLAFQFPPYFIPRPANFDYLASLPERLPRTSSQSSSVTRAGFTAKVDGPKP
jgi:uncharacterized protein YecE (DUF72 family)